MYRVPRIGLQLFAVREQNRYVPLARNQSALPALPDVEK